MATAFSVDLEGLTLQQLRYFRAIADGETFADAAAQIGISQSALSQGIAKLEKVAGVPLLEKAGRRRRLTTAGERVAGYARRVLGETVELASDLDAIRSGAAGSLRIGLIDAAALYIFRATLERYRTAHDGIDLALSVGGSAELETALFEFRIDMAVVVGPSAESEWTPLLVEPLHAYGNSEEAPHETWALYPTGSRTRAAIDHGLAAAGFEPTVVAESGNPEVLRQLAALTGSLTVLPEGIGSPDTRLDRVTPNVATREIGLATRPNWHPEPGASALTAALQRDAAESPYAAPAAD